MDPFEKQLLDSLTQSLLEKQRHINSKLRDVEKHGHKLNKILQKKQKKLGEKKDEGMVNALIQRKREIEKQMRLRTQLEERLNIVNLKILEIKKKMT
jgi:phage-related minor tail protein